MESEQKPDNQSDQGDQDQSGPSHYNTNKILGRFFAECQKYKPVWSKERRSDSRIAIEVQRLEKGQSELRD